MNGTLQLRIGDPRFAQVISLDFDDVLVESIQDGLALCCRKTGKTAVLWDNEITEVVRIGGGPTPLSAFMMHELLKQKFEPAS